MEKLGELARQYWFVIVGGGGVLLIFGAVFKWKWAVQHEGGRRFGLLLWIYDQFGETGYRIATGITGGLIVVFTVIYALILAKM